MMSLLLLVLLGWGSQQPPRDRPAPVDGGTARITGRVIVADSAPAVPIRRARVSLSGGSLRIPEVTDTDIEGNYRFTGLAPGSYRVTASKPGFVTLEAGPSRAGQRGPAIEIAAGQTVRAGVALPRGAAIEGLIVDREGEPVQNILVSASRFTYSALGRRPASVKQVRTDDLGRYRIHSLPAGDYIVEAAPDPRLEINAGFQAGADRPPGRARTYFPGTPLVHLARAVSLTAGQEVRGTDFALEAVPLARVSGRVVDSTGKPVNSYGFRLLPVGGTASVAGITRPDGVFQFPSVPPGDYWMMAAVLASPTAVAEYSVQRVTIAGQDMPDVTVATTPGTVLEGQIATDDGPAPPDLGGVRVVAVETEYELPATRPPVPPATPGADGRFSIRGLFGPRVVRVTGLPAGWALKSVWLDESEITDVVTDFRTSNAPRRLRLVVTNATGSLIGNVRAGSVATKAYQVIVFAAGEPRRGATSRFSHRGAPRADGTFMIRGLLPGQYIAVAVDHVDDGVWNDPDVLRKLAAGGSAFSIGQPGTHELTLELQVLR